MSSAPVSSAVVANPSLLASWIATFRFVAVALLLTLLGAETERADAQVFRDYRCLVERVVTADPSTQPLEQKWYVGEQFTVDRRTGVMVGALKNLSPTRPIVVDLGSSENSYKVVTIQEQGLGRGPGHASLLVIKEFVDAPKKPFLFADDDRAYFGTCTHF